MTGLWESLSLRIGYVKAMLVGVPEAGADSAAHLQPGSVPTVRSSNKAFHFDSLTLLPFI